MTAPDLEARLERNRRLVESMPDNHLARFGYANALLDAARTEEAAEQYRLCLAAQPEWMAAAISLGRCLVTLGQAEEARSVLQSARRMAMQQGHSSPLAEIADLESRLD